jgi:hypothetical protein
MTKTKTKSKSAKSAKVDRTDSATWTKAEKEICGKGVDLGERLGKEWARNHPDRGSARYMDDIIAAERALEAYKDPVFCRGFAVGFANGISDGMDDDPEDEDE